MVFKHIDINPIRNNIVQRKTRNNIKISNGVNKGFTVSEVLIVAAIISILSLVMLPYYNAARQQLAVQRSASKLAQDIRSVIERTVSAREEPACVGTSGYKYGYGISLRESVSGEYILFADCNGNGSYQSGSDELVGQGPIEFESGVEIENLSRNNLDIVFEPPDPAVTISNNDDTAVITIRSTQYNEKQRTIIINKVGLVNIN